MKPGEKVEAIRIKGYSEIKRDKVCYYFEKRSGNWNMFHPDTGLGDLGNHNVTEHDDGTITVSPSIMITFKTKEGEKSCHGYLEKGVWREV